MVKMPRKAKRERERERARRAVSPLMPARGKKEGDWDRSLQGCSAALRPSWPGRWEPLSKARTFENPHQTEAWI